MSRLTAGSLFTGIGGIDLALERAGFEIRFQVENDSDCNRVLAHHWPGVRRYGDVREVDVGELEPVDLIVGGWPCQGNSVAGQRGGMADPRSGLFSEVVRIARALTPRWLLLENVPGLRSVHKGRDMGVVLRALGELGFWWAYRSLDAQYFNVPQRRERVFFVCNSRDPGGPVKVLFESESCSGHPPPSREAGERAAHTLAASVRGTGDGHGNAWNSNYVAANTLGWRACEDNFIAHTLRAEGADASEDGTGRGVPIVTVDNGGYIGYDGANGGEQDAPTDQTRSREVLRAVRAAVGEEAMERWGLGVIASLRPAEVLQSGMCMAELPRSTGERGRGSPLGPREGTQDSLTGALRDLWEAGCARRVPQEWKLDGQLARELDACLSELSHQDPSQSKVLRGLWEASEGLGLLQHALCEIQGDWRPAQDQDPTTEEMPGVRGDGQRQGIMRQALHASEEGRYAGQVDRNSIGGAQAGLAVRRLTPL